MLTTLLFDRKSVNQSLLLFFILLSSEVSSFLVKKGTPGFSLGQKIEDKCGMRASMTAELVFDNVQVISYSCSC